MVYHAISVVKQKQMELNNALALQLFPFTLNQELNALMVVYRHVLEKDIEDKELDAVRAVW